MAFGLNKHQVIGNLGRDPEVRYTESGTAVATLSIGVSYRAKEGDDWVDKTEWVRAVLFGRNAEVAEKYAFTGRQVYVEGPLTTRSYEKDGETKYITETKGQIFMLLGNKNDAPAASNGQAAPVEEEADDDLPF